ncbi:MAG: hypothetical protein COZ37_06835 [bacterium (Candidatus Ratteibacteria) CG_4_10_14_3_um_filter_41_18]|uniref:RND efflux pump membrane fusion protein barrel-sandwich domain-containing protein n=4 Tax=Candidatus Ratteibacteria TaxID=2979319 RepID=A0A2M7EA38_9BACT|nr:MAG: hypothetical protein AUJ76_01935 [Candidatus Omnitrophica bacterium CG1_02_41_171]PIV64610.1 MAG: hypothetical protein COS11_01305 [bacterium (Candidatus Ratteibacteria) CG01_land_8_20_14_3_00_40_19]PIW33771.1 MAG: hypothetical protein COW28_02780 [bacterium (Candidatus Ratteibacteria) CG15_BIG_FIL_POST_REV_8_21_14_020_41_12]PIW74030.1 MAG: hypothetical protein CO004_02875 [bacterium (Candidatus Ratteibacteria) CG_4_8_14_3_um_filter_41_36]PIX76644.1 MAG: hypothetical protein COZ37_06835
MKKKIIILCLVVIILLGGIGYRKFKQRGVVKEKEGNAEEIFPVEICPVERGIIQKVISLSGDVFPESEVTLFSKVTGTVEKIYVEEGDRVKKGKFLVKIDDRNLQLQLRSAEESLKQTEINLANIKKNYTRMENLFKEEVITPYEMDQIQAKKEAAEAQREHLKAQVDLVKENLSDCKIYSPLNGIINRRFLDPGELITASSMAKNDPLLLIQDLSIVKVKVAVGEKELGEIKRGQEVKIRVDAYPERIFSGKVSKIGSFIEPLSRTAEVEIKVNNPNYLLKSGMFARAEIVTAEKKDVLLIPNDVISEKGEEKIVFIIDNNTAYIREVKTGLKDWEKTEIVGGLQESDLVVTAGAQRLKNGVKVKIIR